LAIRKNEAGEIIGTRDAEGVTGAALAHFKPSSFRRDADGMRFVDVILSDERTNTIDRHDWWSGDTIREQLGMDEGNIRLDRINNGAPFLRVHRGRDDTMQIGKFAEGSVRVEGKKGERQLVGTVAFVRESDADGERVIQDIEDGIRRNTSVGWREHETIVTQSQSGPDHHFVTDWEPMEGSSVPMGADDGSMFRNLHNRGSAMAGKKKTEGNGTAAAADPKTEARYTETDVAELAEKRAAELADKRAAELAEGKVDEIMKARAERATAIRGLGKALALRVRDVDAMIEERDADGKLVGYDELVKRELAKAEKRESDPKKAIFGGVRAEAGDYDETDIRELRVLSYVLAHRDGQSNETIRRAMASNKKKGKRFIAREMDLSKFDFEAEGGRFVGRSMAELARMCLEAEGLDTRGMGKSEIATLALGADGLRARGLNVSASFPLLLAETLNTSLRIGFEEQPLGFDRWARKKNGTDFRTMFEVTMGETDELEEISEKGLIQSSTIGESREGHKIKEHGRIFGVTHKLIVNDKLGGITELPRKFGASGNRKMRELVVGLLTANGTLLSDNLAVFTNGSAASRSVNDEPVPSVVSIASIDAMAVRMGTRQGIRPEVIAPHMLRHLIFSRRRRTLAKQVLGQLVEARTLNRADSAGITEQVPDDFGDIGVWSDPLIDVYTSGTGAGNTWFGTDGESILYSFLEGEEGVQIAVKESFETRGFKIRATLDFGAGIRDWRGVDRNTGA
jgi:hypothetical protein